MTDLLTHLAGQVLQPSTEVYPLITGQFAPGPDVLAASLLPEPPALNLPLQPIPAALVDRMQTGQIEQTLFDPPMFSATPDVETHTPNLAVSSIQPLQAPPLEKNSPTEVEEQEIPFSAQALSIAPQEERPSASQISGLVDRNEGKQTPTRLSAQPISNSIPPVIESPGVNSHTGEEAGSSAMSPAAIRVDRHKHSAGQHSIPGAVREQTLPQNSERDQGKVIRGSRSKPQLGPDGPREAGWQDQSIPSETDASISNWVAPTQRPESVQLTVPNLQPETPSSLKPPSAQADRLLHPRRSASLAGSSAEVIQPSSKQVDPVAAAILPAAGPTDRFEPSAGNPSISDVTANQSSPKGAAGNPNTFIRSGKGTPEVDDGAPPHVDGKRHSRLSRSTIDADLSDSIVHTPQPTQLAVPNLPPETLPLIQQTSASEANPPQSPRLPFVPTGLSSPEASHTSAEMSDPRATSFRSADFDSSSGSGIGKADRIQAMPVWNKVEHRQSLQSMPYIKIDATLSPSSPQTASDETLTARAAILLHYPADPEQMIRESLQPTAEAHPSPGPAKTAKSPTGSPVFNPASTIRPVIKAEPLLGQKTHAAPSEAAHSTASTVRLTIGRIVVKATPVAARAASTPVSTRRQPSVSLGDYLARHGRNK